MADDAQFIVEQAQALVRINSINPAFSGGATNEREVAGHVAEELRALGMDARLLEPEPGRVSVLGRLAGTGGGPSLMLYAHHDTVGVEEMAEPFSGDVRDGRLYGRGAFDMKGALAACLGALRSLRHGAPLRGDVYLASVADEEVASIGMEAVLREVAPDMAIVTEATDLDLCVAHKGFVWVEVETLGRAAHGSRFEEGIDANMRMGRVLAGLERLERSLRSTSPHPLLGPPSLHAAVLQGGTGASTYAAHCRLEIERRTLPGETTAGVLAEVQAIVHRLSAADPDFRANVRALLARGGFETSAGSRVAAATAAAAREVLGRDPGRIGVAYWMDMALLGEAGADVVCIGPVGAGAHAAEEWVDVESIISLGEILARAARAVCA